ncbi:MAG: D-aminoacylase [Chloroflexi bacterium]|nr:D-aminoacylase [Chloroflexota bacterium]
MNAGSRRFDTVFEDCRVIDGTGNPWYRADVGVQGGKIAGIGVLNPCEAGRRVLAAGKVLCPGFIDVHNHSDVMIFADPAHEAKVRQGITTELLGGDGLSVVPMTADKRAEWQRLWAGLNGLHPEAWSASTVAEYLDKFNGRTPVNVAYLVPHGNLRYLVMGMEDRPASATEIHEMQTLLAQGLSEGAFGFSTGLSYVPAFFSKTEEIVALCEVLGRYGGVHATHLRSYGADMPEAVEEVLHSARATGTPVHLIHYQMTRTNRGRGAEFLEKIDRAREDGIDATIDSYPYTAGSTVLHALIPQWLAAGGTEAMAARLKDPEIRSRLARELESGSYDWDSHFFACLRTEQGKALEGKTIAQAAADSRKPVTDFICDLLLQEDFDVSCVVRADNEADVQLIMRSPYHMVITDALLLGSKLNPRSYGTYPRYLGHYVRELKNLTLEDAIRKMTYFPAQRFGFQDRGMIREGMAADLVLFDPDKVIDTATFAEPLSFPKGIEMVMVNGEFVVEDGNRTEALPGKALRRS